MYYFQLTTVFIFNLSDGILLEKMLV